MSRYKCPNCGSIKTRKDKDPVFGQDTGDRVCKDCDYEGWHTDFVPKQKVDDLKKQDKVE